MSRISRFALITIAAAGIATPAAAFDPAARHARLHAGTSPSGLNALAMVPADAFGSASSPAATGGGSFGYNDNLRRDAW